MLGVPNGVESPAIRLEQVFDKGTFSACVDDDLAHAGDNLRFWAQLRGPNVTEKGFEIRPQEGVGSVPDAIGLGSCTCVDLRDDLRFHDVVALQRPATIVEDHEDAKCAIDVGSRDERHVALLADERSDASQFLRAAFPKLRDKVLSNLQNPRFDLGQIANFGLRGCAHRFLDVPPEEITLPLPEVKPIGSLLSHRLRALDVLAQARR